jgi:hypothetical protein
MRNLEIKERGRTFVRPLIVMRFIRCHYSAQKGGATNLGSLSEPRREQNLSANPKRTAKFKSFKYYDVAIMRLVKNSTLSTNLPATAVYNHLVTMLRFGCP